MSYIGVEKGTGAMHWLGSTPPEAGAGDMEIVYIPNTVAIDNVNADLAAQAQKAASDQEKLRENLSFYLFTFSAVAKGVVNQLSRWFGDSATLFAIETGIQVALSTSSIVRMQIEAIEAFTLGGPVGIAKGLLLESLIGMLGFNMIKTQAASIKAFQLRRMADRMKDHYDRYTI